MGPSPGSSARRLGRSRDHQTRSRTTARFAVLLQTDTLRARSRRMAVLMHVPMVLKNPNHRKTAMPAEWVFANRLQWGLNSILALLEKVQ